MKKKFFTLLIIALAISGLQAQVLQIHKTDGTLITVPLNAIDSITFVEGGGTFVCGTSTITDIDGNVYNTVQIGTQCWMKENLKVGTMINGSQEQTNNGIIEKYCYDNNESNCDTYGGLYQWNEMMQYITASGLQGICPEGWHLPTDAEWTTLTGYVSSQPAYLCNSNTNYIAKALAATTHWLSRNGTCAVGNNLAANNATGFMALPGGTYFANGLSFFNMSSYGYWWSSSQYDASSAWRRYLYNNSAQVTRNFNSKSGGFSVRCLKDN